jgi:hypothetical protein
MIETDPQIPLSLWWAMVIAGSLAWLLYALGGSGGLGWLRRSWILTLMLVGIAAPLAMLLNPIWVQPVLPPDGRPLITVLVDATQSMQVDDCGEGRSRWDAANEIAQQVKTATDEGFELQLMRFDDVVRTLASASTGDQLAPPRGGNTNLSAALRQTLATERPQGHAVVLVSDGAHNAGQSLAVTAAADQAGSLDVPIYTTTLGGNVGATNVAVSVRNPQLMTFPDRQQSVHVRIAQTGFTGRQVMVELSQRDQRIAAKRVRLSGDGLTETDFILRPDDAGLYRYVVSVSPIDGEATTADNRASFQLQVIDEPISVLLLEGKPYWDSKFLAQNLAADPSISLTSLIRVREDRYMRRTDPAQMSQKNSTEPRGEADDVPGSTGWEVVNLEQSDWSSAERLKQYRVVVLGRWTESFLDDESISRLRYWISHEGGALVCSRGAPTSPSDSNVQQKLATLLPVRWSDQTEFRARGKLTGFGSSTSLVPSAETVGDPLVRLPSLALGQRPKLGVGLPQVLVQSATDASGESVPLVSHQPYGSGQTVVVEGAGMWRWAFLPPQQARSQSVYAQLWQGLMQWLISQQELLPGQDLALRSDRLVYVTGDSVGASVLAADPNRGTVPDCLLKSDSESLPKRIQATRAADQSGVFRIRMGNLPPGHYTATLEGLDSGKPGASTEFDVRDPWFERLEVDARPGLMRQIAERSGGRVLTMANVGSVADDFAEHLKISRPERTRRTALWDRPWVLLATLGAWVTCWVTRRKSGLV